MGTNLTSWPPSAVPVDHLQLEIEESPFRFNLKIALETILYIASQVKEPSFRRITVLLYFSDRLHLARYGRFICGDHYIAMKYGPVPRGVYDILKFGQNGFSFPGGSKPVEHAFTVENGRMVVPLRKADLEWLSASELECLDEAIATYGYRSFSELTKLSHDDAWRSAAENQEISIEAIVRSIGNPHGLLEHLNNPHP